MTDFLTISNDELQYIVKIETLKEIKKNKNLTFSEKIKMLRYVDKTI